MLSKGKKNKFERIFFNQKFLTLIGLLAIILMSFPFAKNAVKRYKIDREISDFKKEIVSLQNKNTDLKNFVTSLESDQFIEEYARLNLNLKKPGEEKTVIKTEAQSLSQADSSALDPIFNIPGRENGTSLKAVANPEKWLKYFFKP
jgi:cell division protein FtsL